MSFPLSNDLSILLYKCAATPAIKIFFAALQNLCYDIEIYGIIFLFTHYKGSRKGGFILARQTKRIRKNIQTAQELEEALEEKPQGRVYKPWENIVLVGIICLTMFLLASGWNYFDTVNKGMYSLLLIALLLMYAQRRMEMTPTRETWIRRGIFAAIALALVLFAYAVYMQYLV